MALYTQKYTHDCMGNPLDPYPWRRRFVIMLILIGITCALTYFELWSFVFFWGIITVGFLFGGGGWKADP